MRPGLLIHGRYRLMEQIGAGGNGTVWRAKDELLGRDVAVKHAVSQHNAGDAKRIELLRREANILAPLNHPNILTLFDVVIEGGECWLVMEYVQAPDLGKLGMLPQERVARMGAKLADALAVVHAAGVLHRDIKPSNVLVGDGDCPKLGDFGISRGVHDEVTLTGDGGFTGTPAYVAPEVAGGEPPSEASDVFSLGATLYAAIEGVSPYGRTSSPMAMVRRAAEGRINPALQAGVLAPVLFALMRVDPASRPSAGEAGRLLLGESEEITAPGNAAPGPSEIPPSSPADELAERSQIALQWTRQALTDSQAQVAHRTEERDLARRNLVRTRRSRRWITVALVCALVSAVVLPAIAVWELWPIVTPSTWEDQELPPNTVDTAWHKCPPGRVCGFSEADGLGTPGFAPGCELSYLGPFTGKIASIKTDGNEATLLDATGHKLVYVKAQSQMNVHPDDTKRGVALYVDCK